MLLLVSFFPLIETQKFLHAILCFLKLKVNKGKGMLLEMMLKDFSAGEKIKQVP